VDNIPGVPGIGQKTAAQLLADHGSLDGVLAHLDQLKGKVKATLTEHQDLAKLSRSLATIDRQVPLSATLEDLRLPEADVPGLDTLYRELEFWSLLSGPAPDAPADTSPVQLLETPEAVRAYVASLGDAATVLEYTSDATLPTRGRPLGLAVVPIAASATPEAAAPEPAWISLDDAALAGALAPWLADAAKPKVAHGSKPLSLQLARAGLTLAGVVGDTQLASYLIEPTKLIPHELEQVTREYLQQAPPSAKALLGRGQEIKRWAELPRVDVARYTLGRARLVAELWPKLEAKLE
jgi:DNA polymerase-1